ncbi:hypothetical protein BRC82_08885 [Halobacteriales archaeon QS_1_67_19]|nr:MAG: hypothetical protein BRC82_08885 [Halobacteriales archaeon QS_1_67_19]
MTNRKTSNSDDQPRRSADAYEHTFDPATESVSEELVRAVAALTDSDPTELEVLADVIDPDALDKLFQYHADRRPRNAESHVRFEYNDRRIHISTDGTITIDAGEVTSDG